MKKSKAVLCVLIAYAAVMFAGAKAATLPKTAQIVPAETILLVDISDFNQLVARFEKSSLGRLYKDPSMAAFLESFTDKWRQKLQQDDDPVIRAILDPNGLPEGKVAFAIVSAGAEQEPARLVIGQWGRNADRIRELIEKMASKSIEQGAHRAIESYRDVNMVTLTTEVPPKRVPDWDNYNPQDGNMSMKTVQPPPSKTCYCFIDDCLIAGTDVDAVKFVVAHIQGASGLSLADDVDYVSLMGAVGPYHDIDLYLNIRQLLNRLTARDKTGRARLELANFGLDNLAGLGCSLGVNTNDDGSIRGKAFLKTTGSRRGVLRMFETGLEPIRPPRFIPASAYSMTFVNLDVKRAFDEFSSMMYGIDPAFAMSLQNPLVAADQQGQPAVSLKADIIEYLGSEIVIAQSINKPFSTGAIPTETLIAVSVSNRASLEKSLSLVHKLLMVPNNPEPTRELLGHTIYTLGPVGLPGLGGAMPMQAAGPRAAPPVSRMAFTVTDTHLILGPEPAVERAIRTLSGADGGSIDTAEWFTAAKSAVPSVVGLASLEDTAASAELVWWMLKESSKSRRTNMGVGPTAAVLARPDLWQFGDFTLLPDFNTVRKYFGCSVFYGTTRADGFLFEFKYLKPRNGDKP